MNKEENMNIPKFADVLFSECKNILDNRQTYNSNQFTGETTLQLVARMWSEYLEKPITEADVCMMMVFLKLNREMLKSNKDNIIDAINYLALYEREVRSQNEHDTGRD